MPIKGAKVRKAYDRDRRRRQADDRAGDKLETCPRFPADPAGALAAWSKKSLRIPPGHPLGGKRLELPAFLTDFFREALAVPESLLSIGRKNAKSAGCAVLALGYLVGPLRSPGWRGAVCSVSAPKANELKMQVQAIAEASGLEGLEFRSTPAPGHIAGPGGRRFDVLSADKTAGHASGYDLVLCDELGLLGENKRELVAGLRSSVSARGGRFLALSIQGDGPLTAEMLERKGEPGLAVHHYAAAADCDLDDVEAWRAANPGLGTIKALSYMEHEAARVASTPADQATFRAFDLNQTLNPARVMVCDVADWRACEVDDVPARDGVCVVGFDMGGSLSMGAAVALFRSGRCEVYAAWPSVPDLAARGRNDGKGPDFYRAMRDRGELWIYPGRVLPAGQFLHDVAAKLAGQRVIMAGADRYRRAEAEQALDDVRLRWPITWRGQGAHAVADGSHDVRAFQRRVLSGGIRVTQNLVMRAAIAGACLRFDGAGNPALEKAKSTGRIDAVSAGVIAAGLAEIHLQKPAKRRWKYAGAA